MYTSRTYLRGCNEVLQIQAVAFFFVCRPSSQSQNVIIGSLPKSDALRYRCHTILALQRVMAQLHVKAAAHMPAQSQLRLLAVLQVSFVAASLYKLALTEMTCLLATAGPQPLSGFTETAVTQPWSSSRICLGAAGLCTRCCQLQPQQ